MAQQKLSDISNLLIRLEDDFVRIARNMNAISTTFQSWKRSYGSKNYYNGLKAASWVDKKNVWEEKLQSSLNTFKYLNKELRGIRTALKENNISNSCVDEALASINKKQDLLNSVSASLRDIINFVFESTADDPTNCYIVKDGERVRNGSYKDLSSSLDENNKKDIDTFRTNICCLGSVLHIHSELCKILTPLLHGEVKEIKKEEKVIDVSHSLREQLTQFQKKQDVEQHENDKYNTWVTAQYHMLESLSVPKTRLLLPEEDFGICELPVVLVKSFIREECKERLASVGYRLTRILGNYISISNALLFGIQSADRNDGLQNANKIWKLAKEKNNFGKDLSPVGPLVRKGSHFYALLVPTHFMEYRNSGFVLSEWDLSLC